MGLNDEQEKLRQAAQWLHVFDPCTDHFKAALEHIGWVRAFSRDPKLRKQAEEIAMSIDGTIQRGGAGRNGDGSFPETDGKGCPLCGQIRGGGHGGGCPNTQQYDENGNVIA